MQQSLSTVYPVPESIGRQTCLVNSVLKPSLEYANQRAGTIFEITTWNSLILWQLPRHFSLSIFLFICRYLQWWISILMSFIISNLLILIRIYGQFNLVRLEFIMFDLSTSTNLFMYPLTCLTAALIQINQAILGNHGVDVQFCGINFLESLVCIYLGKLVSHAINWILFFILSALADFGLRISFYS